MYLVGTRHRELVVTGPAATAVTSCEHAAAAGEVVVSPATAALLETNGFALGPSREGGFLLRTAPEADLRPNRRPIHPGVDPRAALSAPLAQHLHAGPAEGEHRRVAVGFVRFGGTDAIVIGQGPSALTTRLAEVVGTAQVAAETHGITFLGTDVDTDGGKLILVAGAPVATGGARPGCSAHSARSSTGATRSRCGPGSRPGGSSPATSGPPTAGPTPCLVTV
jgi:hypothetical protein